MPKVRTVLRAVRAAMPSLRAADPNVEHEHLHMQHDDGLPDSSDIINRHSGFPHIRGTMMIYTLAELEPRIAPGGGEK